VFTDFAASPLVPCSWFDCRRSSPSYRQTPVRGIRTRSHEQHLRRYSASFGGNSFSSYHHAIMSLIRCTSEFKLNGITDSGLASLITHTIGSPFRKLASNLTASIFPAASPLSPLTGRSPGISFLRTSRYQLNGHSLFFEIAAIIPRSLAILISSKLSPLPDDRSAITLLEATLLAPFMKTA